MNEDFVDDSVDNDLDDCAVDEAEVIESVKDINIHCMGGDFIDVDMIPVKKVPCVVSKKLLADVKNIEYSVRKKFGSDNEFFIFLHSDFNDDGEMIISDMFYIPKQTVTGATVECEEQPNRFYNGCLHRHPNGVMSFSGSDERTINSNFEFSLLYVNGKIHLGIYNIKYYGNKRIQVPLEIKMEGEEVSEVDVSSITRYVPPAPVVRPFTAVTGFANYHNKQPLRDQDLPGFEDTPSSYDVLNDDNDIDTDYDENDLEKMLGVHYPHLGL